MIGMDVVSFLILLVISVVVSAILHYVCDYYATPGLWSFCSKIVVGWIGAWLGTPVLGHWLPGLSYGPAGMEIFYIPAILGSLALLIVVVDVAKLRGGGSGGA